MQKIEAPSNPNWQPGDLAEFELIQGGIPVAFAGGKREKALREIQHYAAVYGQDGPVEIREVTPPADMIEQERQAEKETI